jgi:Flp pilus assembly protein TadB
MRTAAAILLGTAGGLGVFMTWAGWRDRRVLPHLVLPEHLCATATARSRRLWWAVLAGLVGWVVTGWPALAGIVVLAAWGLPRLFGGGQRRALIAQTEAIAAWTEMLRDSMAAADGVEQAIEATVPIAPRPIRPAVALLDAARRSRPLPEALRDFGAEVDHPSADLVVQALVIAAEGEGTDFSKVLSRLAAITRGEVRMRLRIEVGRAALRTSARMILVILCVGVVGIALLSRDYLEPYSSAEGQVILVVATGLFAGGCVLLERMSRIELPQRFAPRPRRPAP